MIAADENRKKKFFREFNGQLHNCTIADFSSGSTEGAAPPPLPSHQPSNAGRRADCEGDGGGALGNSVGSLKKSKKHRVFSVSH